MGKFNGTLFRLILLVLPIFLCHAQEDTGTAAELTDFALPEYNKKTGRLEFILYGTRATNLGANVHLEQAKVDVINPEFTRISEIKSLAHVIPYPLMTPMAAVQKYWSDKPQTRALIFTSSADYDKNLKIMKGEAPVFVRTRELAMDGIGFDADHERQFIHIRKKVKIILYSRNKHETASSSEKPQKSISKKEK